MARRASPPAAKLVRLDPPAAVPGGELRLHGENLACDAAPPQVRIGGIAAPVAFASARLIVVEVPENAVSGPVELELPGREGIILGPQPLDVATLIADNLHPVCNPALDPEGNIYVTLSGARGQKTPVSIFKLDANFTSKAWSSTITNPSGLAFDRSGALFASSRADGAVYRVAANGAATSVAEGMGVATGIAFDAAGDLYVGDRNGTIFKLDQQHTTFVFATLEPSVAAYHLAFGPDQHLYVTGPTTSSYDTIWRISPTGAVAPFFRGLGRPQGLAFDAHGDLYVVASHQGRLGVVRIAGDGSSRAELVVSGPNLVGLAFARQALVLATRTAVYHLPWTIAGQLLPPR